MQNQLQIFESEEFGKIRIIERDGQPWFVGKDVCNVFGDSHYRRSIGALDNDEKGVTQIATPGGRQKMIIINESGLYTLLFIMKPAKAKARDLDSKYIAEREMKLKNFRRWVTHDVLPSIRKNGAYVTDDTFRKMAEDNDFANNLIIRLAEEKVKTSALLGKIEQLAPKVLYYDLILQCENAVQTSIIAKDYAMTCSAFNSLLNGLRIQYKAGACWVLYQNYAGKGYTLTKTYRVSDKVAKIHTYWTQLGRQFLYDTLKQYGILPEAERLDGAFAGGDDNLR